MFDIIEKVCFLNNLTLFLLVEIHFNNVNIFNIYFYIFPKIDYDYKMEGVRISDNEEHEISSLVILGSKIYLDLFPYQPLLADGGRIKSTFFTLKFPN